MISFPEFNVGLLCILLLIRSSQAPTLCGILLVVICSCCQFQKKFPGWRGLKSICLSGTPKLGVRNFAVTLSLGKRVVRTKRNQ